jgi:hypothetical protein
VTGRNGDANRWSWQEHFLVFNILCPGDQNAILGRDLCVMSSQCMVSSLS